MARSLMDKYIASSFRIFVDEILSQIIDRMLGICNFRFKSNFLLASKENNKMFSKILFLIIRFLLEIKNTASYQSWVMSNA